MDMKTLHVDGSGDGRICVVDVDTKHVTQKKSLVTTHNESEYHAVILALTMLPRGETVNICSDSQLVVHQLKGDWVCNWGHLATLIAICRQQILTKQLSVNFIWIPREQNEAGRILG